jgi:hypothetical protein
MKVRHVLGVAALLGSAGVASATIIDNGEFGANISPIGGTGSNIYSQGFVAPADNILVQFGMWLQGGGVNAAPVRIDLWADDGLGNPDETNILVAGTVHQGDLPTLTRIDTFTSFALTPGLTYHVVINGLLDQTMDPYNSTWDGATDTVPSGHMNWSNDKGATWSGGIANGDFGVYVETIPAPGVLGLLCVAGVLGARRRRR